MATIDELIKQSLNPFDNNAARNFWEDQEPAPTVESIHKEALNEIKSLLSQTAQDHQTRTLILYGDAGAGKTHFLGRLKQTLNDQAFFAYIEPFPQSDHIWRHILRHTIDSLVNAPAGQTDSQLLLWIKSCLSTIREDLLDEQQSLVDKIKGFFGKQKTNTKSDRQLFIDILKRHIGNTGIYNANEFFGVLYDLTNPDLYFLACEWLKGDNLDEESLNKLRVRQSIDSENTAKGILGNFSKISAKTQPIVLCFDNLDNIARLPDGSIDIQALFNVNSAIYNGKWQGFLIIISIKTGTWNDNFKRVQPADLDRATIRVSLKRITLEEGEALLASRLHPLYRKAYSLPDSSIYPINTEVFIKAFPSRKTSPRQILTLGRNLFHDYKQWLFRDKKPPKPKWLDGETPDPSRTHPPEEIQGEHPLLEDIQVLGEYNNR
ncbi:AAA family ATPase, partial [Anabaena sp. CCY 9402-a]|uniref:AAA family ATPase n=1 Tax=Anabaena sp. CCY 9402-a TaxID=3103867 RepID=UPI0039C641D6